MFSKMKQLGQKAIKTTGDAVSTLTGTKLGKEVQQFAEKFGEILLGMDREIKSQRKLIQDYRQEMLGMLNEVRTTKTEIESAVRMANEISAVKEEMERAERLAKRALRFSIVTLLLSLIAIGGLIWMNV